MFRNLNKYYIAFALVIVLTLIVGRIYTELSGVNAKITDFYNDKNRPSVNGTDWSSIEDDGVTNIVKTPSNFLTPKYTVVSAGTKGEPFDVNNPKVGVKADVVKFKWDLNLRLVPDELISNIFYATKSYNDVLALAKKVDISEINKGKSVDDPTYDKSVTTFKNPSKEKIAARIEAAKLKPRFKIENPSKTDYIEYSRSDDLSDDAYLIKSTNGDPTELGLEFNNIQRSIDGEQFTYWLNDDEFIYMVDKNNNVSKEWIAKVKDYADGIYTFNTKTQERKMFIPINDPDDDFSMDYEVLSDRLTIYTSTGSKDYDKNTGKPL